MKKILILVLILNFGFVYGQRKSKEVVEVEFTDGLKTEVTFHTKSPYLIHEDHIALRILNFKVAPLESDDVDATGGGPVGADFEYRKYLNELDFMLAAGATYLPLDIANMNDGTKREFQKINLSFDLYGHYSFIQNERIRSRTLNFKRNKTDNIIYRFEHRIPFLRTYNVRSGIHYFQQGMYSDFSDGYRIQSGSSTGVFLGLSTNKIVNLEYESDDFGREKTGLVNEMFIDFIYAPISNIYGISNNEMSSIVINENGRINDEKLYQNELGFRVGFSQSSKWYYSFEFGALPIYDSLYYIHIKIGPVIRRN